MNLESGATEVDEVWWGGDRKTPLSSKEVDARRDRILRTLERCGISLPRGAKVLDFGCGDGSLVDAFCRAGFDAWGAEVNSTYRRSRIELADPSTGTLPFEDDSFDFVLSYTVLEHVSGDQSTQFDEFQRVLKPDGAALNFFPPRLGLIETHTLVPLASVVRSSLWLRVWATVGTRPAHQRGRAAREVAAQNRRFLAERTNYLSRRHYARLASSRFLDVRFVEAEFVRGEHGIAQLLDLAPPLWRAYSAVRFRVLLTARPVPYS